MLKKVLFLWLALLFVSGAVSAQLIWFSLYADESRSTSSVLNVTAGSFVRVYLFVCPNAEGVICIELGMVAEGGAFMPFASVYHADVAQPVLATGFPTGDVGGCWNTCKYDWTYFVYADLYVQSTDQIYLTIGGFQGPPVQPWPKILTCGGVELEGWILCDFCINTLCACDCAVEESTWGAIKNMYE